MLDSLTLSGNIWHDVNAVAWVVTNLLIVYIAAMVMIFVLGYYALFNPKATTGGRYIFRFFVSLMVLTTLLFVTLFVDPSGNRTWSEFPSDVMPWRPLARLAGYMYVAYAITSLAYLLVIRKWWPERLQTATSDTSNLQTRSEEHIA